MLIPEVQNSQTATARTSSVSPAGEIPWPFRSNSSRRKHCPNSTFPGKRSPVDVDQLESPILQRHSYFPSCSETSCCLSGKIKQLTFNSLSDALESGRDTDVVGLAPRFTRISAIVQVVVVEIRNRFDNLTATSTCFPSRFVCYVAGRVTSLS